MESIINELTDGGWVRVGPYSPYWKAPDDTGDLGRKWPESKAHAEMMARRAARPKPAPRAKSSSTKKKTSTAKKAD